MPIALTTLEQAARTNEFRRSVTVESAKLARQRSAFICHSHKDQARVQGLVSLLAQAGFSPYVDWGDTELPSAPDKSTAAKIRTVIRDADLFLFLATPNSMASRWCPWEIGYADGVKPLSTILIIPTVDGVGTRYGNEYLQLYRRIDVDTDVRLLKFYEPGQFTSHSLASL